MTVETYEVKCYKHAGRQIRMTVTWTSSFKWASYHSQTYKKNYLYVYVQRHTSKCVYICCISAALFMLANHHLAYVIGNVPVPVMED